MSELENLNARKVQMKPAETPVEASDVYIPEILKTMVPRNFPEVDFYNATYKRYLENKNSVRKHIYNEIADPYYQLNDTDISPEIHSAVRILSAMVAGRTIDTSSYYVQDRNLAVANGDLVEALKEFGEDFSTPETVTKIFQRIWQTRGELAGVMFPVSPCDRSADELRKLIENGRRIGYLPEQVMDQQRRHVLYKFIGSVDTTRSSDLGLAENTAERFGWFDYEASSDPPPYYSNITEEQLGAIIEAEGEKLGRRLVGMNLNEYIVASNDNYLFTGRYFDQDRQNMNLYTRLLGTRCVSGYKPAAIAQCDSNGRVNVTRGVVPPFDNMISGRSVGYKDKII